MQKLGKKNLHLGKFGAKSEFCRKFEVSVGKLQLPAQLTLLAHNAAEC